MKILVTGGSGLLGQYLNISLSIKNEILTLYHSNAGNCTRHNFVRGNIIDEKFTRGVFESFQPQIVIHTAAITNPILNGQYNLEDYERVNVTATELIAQQCENFKSKLIYTSTDLVYSGNEESMLKEDALLRPISVYAETKLKGETKIKETFDNYLILRTALLFGFGLNHSRSFFDKMFDSLSQNIPINLFIDQFRTPLSLIEAARMISEIIELDIKSETINFAGLNRISRYELGELLCEAAGYNKNLLNKISMKEIPDYPQVKDVSLNTDKLQSFGIKSKSIEESLMEIISERRNS
ncbi:MAG: NAD(P)-dependent oxidoreductase [Ignavibacteriales bacterium]|nr:NAD(P)-dependent oxidoreductase [Ignavibacteriales bacterium]